MRDGSWFGQGRGGAYWGAWRFFYWLPGGSQVKEQFWFLFHAPVSVGLPPRPQKRGCAGEMAGPSWVCRYRRSLAGHVDCTSPVGKQGGKGRGISMGIEAWKRGIAKRAKAAAAGSLGLGVFDPLRGPPDVDGGWETGGCDERQEAKHKRGSFLLLEKHHDHMLFRPVSCVLNSTPKARRGEEESPARPRRHDADNGLVRRRGI